MPSSVLFFAIYYNIFIYRCSKLSWTVVKIVQIYKIWISSFQLHFKEFERGLEQLLFRTRGKGAFKAGFYERKWVAKNFFTLLLFGKSNFLLVGVGWLKFSEILSNILSRLGLHSSHIYPKSSNLWKWICLQGVNHFFFPGQWCQLLGTPPALRDMRQFFIDFWNTPPPSFLFNDWRHLWTLPKWS